MHRAQGRVSRRFDVQSAAMELPPQFRGERAADFHRAVLDTAVLGIITIDVRGTILSANPAAIEMFGWTQEELLGKNVSLLMPAPHAEQHDGYVQRYLDTGEKRIIGIGRDIQCLRKDGSLFEAELAISEIVFEDQRYFTGFSHGKGVLNRNLLLRPSGRDKGQDAQNERGEDGAEKNHHGDVTCQGT